MIRFAKNLKPEFVPDETVKRIRKALDTPYKYGAVVKTDGFLCDSPSVFCLKGKWYMMYLKINKDCHADGYETHIAESDDLLNWRDVCPVLTRQSGESWDAKQIAGYLGLADIDLGKNREPAKINGNYVVTYLGGNADGYEPVPLYAGLARTPDLLKKDLYIRNDKPLFTPFDTDARESEKLAIYRSFLFYDEKQVLGYPYVLIYNAKDKARKERILLAVSNDGISFERYGEDAVIDLSEVFDGIKISADAQIIKIGDVYTAIFFALDESQKAYSTFACSYDLIHWSYNKEAPLIESSEDFDNLYAHKSFIVERDGVIYNYYCAVNTAGERFIALATSRKV